MILTVIKRLSFLILFISLFKFAYRRSDQPRLHRWRSSFKTALIAAAVFSGLVPIRANASDTIVTNQATQIEKIYIQDGFEFSKKSDEPIILIGNSQTSYSNALDGYQMKNNSNQALVLSNKIKSVNLNLDYPSTIVSRTLHVRGGDDWKFGPGSKARGAARGNKGGSLFAEAFSPVSRNHRYMDPNPLSGRYLARPSKDPFNRPGNDDNHCGGYRGGSNDLGKYDNRKAERYQETENEKIFRECSVNPKTKEQDLQSIDEAKAILQVKKKGWAGADVARPDNLKVDLDFAGTGLGHYTNVTHFDIKTVPSIEDFNEQGIQMSGPNTYTKIGKKMGQKLIAQKSRFCGIEGGPAGPDNVLHIIDLRKIPDYFNRSVVVKNVLDAAEQAGNTTKNIAFLGFD